MRSRLPFILTIVWLVVLGASPCAWAAVVLGPLDGNASCTTGGSDRSEGEPSPSAYDREGGLVSHAAVPVGSMSGSPSAPGGGSLTAVALISTAVPPVVPPLVYRVVDPVLRVPQGVKADLLRPPKVRLEGWC